MPSNRHLLRTLSSLSLQPLQAKLAQLGSNLAMHSAGMNTQYASKQHIPAEALEAVRADLASAAEAQMSGKPAAVMQKIVEGKLAKWCKDVSIGLVLACGIGNPGSYTVHTVAALNCSSDSCCEGCVQQKFSYICHCARSTSIQLM